MCACPGSKRPANARAGKGGASAPEPRTKGAREHIRRSNQAKIRGAGEKRRILFGSHGNAEKALPGDKVIREGAFPRCASTQGAGTRWHRSGLWLARAFIARTSSEISRRCAMASAV